MTQRDSRLVAAAFTPEEWDSACAHVRVRGPLGAAGIEIAPGSIGPQAALDLSAVARADAAVVQRDFPRDRAAYAAVRDAARGRGIPLIYEIDDLLWAVPADHPAHGKYRDAHDAIISAVIDADLITTTTEPLAERLRALNPDVIVLPNCIDPALWSAPQPRAAAQPRAITIGYAGGGTHAPDLETIAGALGRVATRYGDRIAFSFMGDAPPPALAALPNVTRALHRPDYAAYAAQLRAQSWDIALAPLRASRFNRCKSALKFLEYSCLPVAAIYSDVAPYRDAVTHGENGLLASDEQSWVDALARLIDDAALRDALAAGALATVKRVGLLDQHAGAWRDAYRDAIARGPRARPPLPTVSVIVLNYNGRRYLDDCLSSLAQQEYPAERYDVVLADNGSTDDSIAHARAAHPRAQVLAFDRNLGFCAGYNRAVAQCDADLVAMLNNDMRVEPDWLIQLVRALDRDDGVVCAGAKILSWDGSAIDFAGHEMSPLGYARGLGGGEADLSAHDGQPYLLAASAGSLLIDRRTFIDAGGFDEAYFAYFEDLDLGWRLWILGHKVAFAPRAVAYHMHFGTSSRIPGPQVAYLYERNTLYTLIKNLDQRAFERTLAMAVLMRAKHASMLGRRAGLNMDRARFRPGVLAPAQPAPPAQYGLRHYLAESARALREDGVLGWARRVLDELDRRRGRRLHQTVQDRDLLAEHLHDADINDFLAQEALWHEQAQLAAIDDVIERFDALMAQRAALQSQRRRGDDEIFALTHAITARPWFDAPEYARAHRRLYELLGLGSTFNARDGERQDPATPTQP